MPSDDTPWPWPVSPDTDRWVREKAAQLANALRVRQQELEGAYRGPTEAALPPADRPRPDPGTNYRFARPGDDGDPAEFRVGRPPGPKSRRLTRWEAADLIRDQLGRCEPEDLAELWLKAFPERFWGTLTVDGNSLVFTEAVDPEEEA